MSKGKLFLIPNVLAPDTQDIISPQVREVIQSTRYYLGENLRTTRRYISSLKLGVDIGALQIELLDKRTPVGALGRLLEPLMQGHDVGIISEAGCPGIADPGAQAVQYAHEQGCQVVPLSGPSSMFLALMGSGFNGQRFTFHGYLPIDKKQREQAIKKLESQALQGHTQLFMETPFRNNQLLDSLLQQLQPGSLLCIGSNLTARDEMIRTLRISDWKKQKPDLHKIPTVFLLGTMG